jgi:hypothetical protein
VTFVVFNAVLTLLDILVGNANSSKSVLRKSCDNAVQMTLH